MFFHFSRVLWSIVAPSHLATWFAVAATVLLFQNKVRTARWLSAGSAAILLGSCLLPVGVWLMLPLENMYPPAALPAHVDGILILGGGTDPEVYASRGVPNFSAGATRLIAAAALARAHPEARVAFTGGPAEGRLNEAQSDKRLLKSLGLSPERLMLEDRSRNTYENFMFTKELVKPKPGQIWVLVTSAWHMPRAMAIARRISWTMLPYPSDYTTTGGTHYNHWQFTVNLDRTDWAVHEWIGLIAYRLTGKS